VYKPSFDTSFHQILVSRKGSQYQIQTESFDTYYHSIHERKSIHLSGRRASEAISLISKSEIEKERISSSSSLMSIIKELYQSAHTDGLSMSLLKTNDYGMCFDLQTSCLDIGIPQIAYLRINKKQEILFQCLYLSFGFSLVSGDLLLPIVGWISLY
jgi:hypothetical protein